MFIKILFNYRGDHFQGERTHGECVVRANGPDTGFRVARSLVFCEVFCRLLIPFSVGHCVVLSFFDVRLLITILVFSNSSYTCLFIMHAVLNIRSIFPSFPVPERYPVLGYHFLSPLSSRDGVSPPISFLLHWVRK